MTYRLYVDGARWRRHLAAVRDDLPGIVPVAKGNGYGLGVERLAAEAASLGVGAIAVGVPEEVTRVRTAYDGDVLVLAPYHPAVPDAPCDSHVVRTVSHLGALEALAAARQRPRVVVELATSIRRHGLSGEELAKAASLLEGVHVEGLALHLPIDGSHVEEAASRVTAAREAGLPAATVWVSHLSAEEVRRLAGRTGARVRPRIGTRLWLGDRGALQVRGTVLDVHRLDRGDRYGYRQRRAVADGHLVVVSGGTAHGVGLEAPKHTGTPLSRAKVFALGALAAAGHTTSPFWVAGRQRRFAEPPHMQVSMLLLTGEVAPPAIGEELDCDARLTTTHPDEVVLT